MLRWEKDRGQAPAQPRREAPSLINRPEEKKSRVIHDPASKGTQMGRMLALGATEPQDAETQEAGA